MKPKQGYEKLRKGRYSEIGYTYHVVFSTTQRKPIFTDLFLARQLIKILKKDQEFHYTETLSFVVMPDHIHWLMTLRKGTLEESVQRIKSLFSKQTDLKIWDKGFFDHAIRADESLVNVARYIVANPLRANLVKEVGDYPHWDSVWL